MTTSQPSPDDELDEILYTLSDDSFYELRSAHSAEKSIIAAKALITSREERLVTHARLDELIWATGGIREFTDDGKEVIQGRIENLLAQLNKLEKGDDAQTK